MCKKLTVATVLKPQGILGEIKVKAQTDSAEDLKAFKKVLTGGEEYSVLSVRASGDFAFLGLKGVADRNTAELLRGKDVEVYRDEIPALPEGRYYIADLIGCEVVTEKGVQLGTVTSVTPARTDIYVIRRGEKEITFASADGVITDIDVPAGKIYVNSKRFKEVSL